MAYSNPTNRDSQSKYYAEQIRDGRGDDPARRLHVSVKKATEAGRNEYAYQMMSEPRGLAVIFNYKNFPDKGQRRDGSEADVENLKELCKQLDFEVQVHEDLDKEETHTKLDDVVRNPSIANNRYAVGYHHVTWRRRLYLL